MFPTSWAACETFSQRRRTLDDAPLSGGAIRFSHPTNADTIVKALKREVSREGIIGEIRRHQFFVPKGQRGRSKAAWARFRRK